MRSNAIESVSIDGRYVRRNSDGTLEVTKEGLLGPEAAEGKVRHIRAGPSRDISATTAGVNTFLRELCVEYENGEISTTFVIPKSILEYRSTVGIRKTYSRGGRSWDGTYMGTYCSLGVPAEVHGFIKDSFGTGNHVDLAEGVSVVEGYAWLRAKLLQGDDSLKLVYREGSVTKVRNDPADFMSRLKCNVLGTASLSMRLKRSNINRARAKAMPWTLSVTLHTFQMHDVTQISGPKLNRGPRVFVDDQDIEEALAIRMADLNVDEEHEGVVEQEYEEEETSGASGEDEEDEQGTAKATSSDGHTLH